jgi:DNA-binding NtrC family response regulator
MESAPDIHQGKKKLTPRVLVADDEETMREVVVDVLRLEGYHVEEFDPHEPNHSLLRNPWDVAILDMVMPGTDGFLLREEILRHSPASQFIAITGFPDREKLDRAMELGIFTFLTKPFTAEQIRYAVLGALRMRQFSGHAHERDIQAETEHNGLIGRSPKMQNVRRQIQLLAPIDIPVLLTGESGTGKEVVARCVHCCSKRSEQAFTAINCAGLSPSLMESELFGHVQGAFTGATKTKHGFFEVSDGGTLFLDEIGDLPLELQSKLLRVLDSGEYSRVGEATTRNVDVRVISATNRDLETMVREGQFRADLYYRLRGAHITLPPLRERREDIPALISHFLGDEQAAITPDAVRKLSGSEWHGNVRELKMIVRTLQGTRSGRVITAEMVERLLGGMLTTDTGSLMSYAAYKEGVLRNAERDYFEALLIASEGNMSRAAATAGMHRKNLYDKLRQLGISREG